MNTGYVCKSSPAAYEYRLLFRSAPSSAQHGMFVKRTRQRRIQGMLIKRPPAGSYTGYANKANHSGVRIQGMFILAAGNVHKAVLAVMNTWLCS